MILSLVNPYENLREELKKNNTGQVIEILLTSDRDLRKDYHVKDFEVGIPMISINTDRGVEDSFQSLLACMVRNEN